MKRQREVVLATPLLETTILGGEVIGDRTEVVEDGDCFEADRVVDSLIRYLGTTSHSAHSHSIWITNSYYDDWHSWSRSSAGWKTVIAVIRCPG